MSSTRHRPKVFRFQVVEIQILPVHRMIGDTDIINLYESRQQMHQLAHEYYQIKHWTDFYRSMLLMLTISFLVVYVSFAEEDESRKKIISILVAILSICPIIVEGVNKRNNFAAKSEGHRIIAWDIAKLLSSMKLSEYGISESEHVKFYNQIMESFRFIIPIRITQAFILMRTQMDIGLSSNNANLSASDKQSIRRIANQYLSIEFQNNCLWPIRLMDPHVAVQRALNRLNCEYGRLGEEQIFASLEKCCTDVLRKGIEDLERKQQENICISEKEQKYHTDEIEQQITGLCKNINAREKQEFLEALKSRLAGLRD